MNDSCFENEWKDIDIIKQDEGPYAIMPIAYTQEYVEKMDILRSIIKKGEKSERALKLTQEIIEMSPANYVIWKYRQDILEALNKDLKEELILMEELAEDNQKCYQLWHHRQLIIEKLNDPLDELNYIDKMIVLDSKNYNAWTYRQWLVKKFNFWDTEIQYSDKVIKIDHRNNSAWNYRYFILTNKPNTDLKKELENEINYVKQRINFDPTNQSPWQYIKGLIEKSNTDITTLVDFEKFCQDIQKEEVFPHAVQFLMDIQEHRIKKNDENKSKYIEDYQKLCQILEESDPIRKKFWEFKKNSY